MKITAIVSDLDDTLLNDTQGLSDLTVETLRACEQKGVRFIAASGRAIPSMRGYAERLAVGEPYIACNGGQLVAPDHHPMETLALPRELALEILQFLHERGFYAQVYNGEHFYFAEECDRSRAYARVSGMVGVPVGDLRSFLSFDTPKVLSIHEPEAVAAVYAEACERFAGRAVFTISKPIYLEAQPPHATKGEALARLAGRIGLDLRTTVAFGDSLNDVSMLQTAGLGVAVENARPEVKAAAGAVCGSNQSDGVARFLREHVLEGV